MTHKEQTKLTALEAKMRDNGIVIAALCEDMETIDKSAAKKAMQGIIDYLKDKLDQSA